MSQSLRAETPADFRASTLALAAELEAGLTEGSVAGIARSGRASQQLRELLTHASPAGDDAKTVRELQTVLRRCQRLALSGVTWTERQGSFIDYGVANTRGAMTEAWEG